MDRTVKTFLLLLMCLIFSNAKKCSNGGRALMQLDFTQFLSKFEKLTSIKPIPNREFVEAYVKAYYQPDTELEAWIKEHSSCTGYATVEPPAR
uniref:Syndetin C-terminal domain-containing protein n=1 Tax=Timema genevievae TaxID=629358 RepID=A0A7R9JW64_TIMGE|nr:unnamed protein product [Timema genevievae]